MQLKDTKIQNIYSIYMNGGTIYTDRGHQTFYDTKNDKFICNQNGKNAEFKKLEELLAYVALYDAEISEKEGQNERFQWYVVDHERAYGSLPRKQDAINFCSKIAADTRVNKSVMKIEASVYLYVGPRMARNKQYYIGLRDALMKQGFSEQILNYENKVQKKGYTFA